VGDSEPDIQTGINAGCATIGCTWGFRNRDVLESEFADLVIDDPENLLEIIDDIQSGIW
jgi:phosphoglycolate phosphatase